MTDRYDVFLSYSHGDEETATILRGQLRGLSVFFDKTGIREGDLWLNRLEEALDACGSFVVLVGRDGVRRWVGAETQVALNRHFGPHDDASRLPIFPVLLGDTKPETLPAFLRLFQSTLWNGADTLPGSLLDQIRARASVPGKIPFEGCPFVGLNAYQPDQAHLFFGRQKETLDALACFDTRPGGQTVRWLEINGNSGCGKSSLMNAGILPLVDQGWLWPRTGIETWRRIGPMMPGERPTEVLAEVLANAFRCEMADVHERLNKNEDGLRMWLRGRKEHDTAFLLAVDQFEELFTFADPAERARFDHLLAAALADADCPLFVISTVRADFLDRFDDLPRLMNGRNRAGKQWTLPLISVDGLREVIAGPARLAGLDVGEVQAAMVAEAQEEPGGLPLVENALEWLWQQRTNSRLSGRLLTEQGGLAGVLSHNADDLLLALGAQRDRALELLFRLVKVDPEGRRHTRQRMPLAEAVAVAGGGKGGEDLVYRLAGEQIREGGKSKGSLRLIMITEDAEGATTAEVGRQCVNLIHETLIRSRRSDADGNPRPYWPTLWRYVEENKDRAVLHEAARIFTAIRRRRLRLQAQEWQYRNGIARLLGLVGWLEFFELRVLSGRSSIEQRYLRWSAARMLVQVGILVAIVVIVGENMYWAAERSLPLRAVGDRWSYMLFKQLPSPHLVEIPSGSFEMGSSPGEQPPHNVTFAQPFELGATEVTFREWDACVVDDACKGDAATSAPSNTMRPASGTDFWGRDMQPVINVSWEDANAYAKWLGRKMGRVCRLPSEAEWEYACRAGTKTEYALPSPEGSDDIARKGLANCDDCGSEGDGKRTAPVGSFPANAWGLHDMHGNVWEWVEDCWHYSYEDAPGEGQAWLDQNGGRCDHRVIRGGSWVVGQHNARCAFRLGAPPSNRSVDVGFRVVCSPPLKVADH